MNNIYALCSVLAKYKTIVMLILTALLVSCADVPVKLTSPFQLSGRDHLYAKESWSFAGRMAVSDKNDSFSSSIAWKHRNRQDELELAGLFGQGRTLIEITDSGVLIDNGDERLQYLGNADELLSRQVGVDIPVSYLKYWVLGLVKPEAEYDVLENGFEQAGWNVKYLQMQSVGGNDMPRKIRVEQGDVKLKLIINNWDLPLD
ncbi:MAG: outer membrane lipoprotein LolB [Methylococcales bacterium]|nr:outer membrane lipoprotein LolB [Methylococcales bacterium]